jgi:hypothetical protein
MRNSGPGDKTPDAERRTTSPAKSNTFIEITDITTNLCYNYIGQLIYRPDSQNVKNLYNKQLKSGSKFPP